MKTQSWEIVLTLLPGFFPPSSRLFSSALSPLRWGGSCTQLRWELFNVQPASLCSARPHADIKMCSRSPSLSGWANVNYCSALAWYQGSLFKNRNQRLMIREESRFEAKVKCTYFFVPGNWHLLSHTVSGKKWVCSITRSLYFTLRCVYKVPFAIYLYLAAACDSWTSDLLWKSRCMEATNDLKKEEKLNVFCLCSAPVKKLTSHI